MMRVSERILFNVHCCFKYEGTTHNSVTDKSYFQKLLGHRHADKKTELSHAACVGTQSANSQASKQHTKPPHTTYTFQCKHAKAIKETNGPQCWINHKVYRYQ